MGFKENLKSELSYSGLLVKELAEKAGVNKHSIDNYLNKRGQLPSVEVGVKIAQALGVSVEYLVTGKDKKNSLQTAEITENEAIIKYLKRLSDKKRASVLDYIKWLNSTS